MTYVAPRIVNSVSCVKRIQHEIHFSWQAQYLVRLEDDTSCSAHCKFHFAWQAHYLVKTLVAPRIVNDVSYVMRINHEIHFAWQAQYLVKLEDDSCCSAHCQ